MEGPFDDLCGAVDLLESSQTLITLLLSLVEWRMDNGSQVLRPKSEERATSSPGCN
jgi:hypothetical protein